MGMRLTSRILPTTEWHRVTLPETAAIVPYLRPDKDDVIVVEDEDGRIVGAWCVIETLNLHGCSIAPDLAGQPAVAFRLLREMKALARAKGFGKVTTGAMSDEIDALCVAIGAAPLPGRHYVLSVKE